jgi:hypothetical protein
MRQPTTTKRGESPVEARAYPERAERMSAAVVIPTQATRLPLRQRSSGFTLAELVVTVGVLVLLVFLATQLLNSAATVTTLGHKQIDADSQARQLLDRMAIDFAQLMKRNDLDFFAKNTAAPNSAGGPMNGTGGQTSNDRIAFYSSVPGYYPPAGAQSPVSLVAYRVNSNNGSSSFNSMQRMGKGLVWNGVDPSYTPVAFMPIKIADSWAAATSSSTSDAAYEVIGPQVFRFEYCYQLTNGDLSITPPLDGNSHADLSQIAAIIVDIAVIDPKSKVLLTPAQITSLAGQLIDWPANTSLQQPSYLRTQWQTKLNGIIDPNSPDYDATLPRSAVSGIRLYQRFFYLSPPVQ